MKTNQRGWAIVGCFIVGVVGGAASAQRRKIYDKPKATIGGGPTGDRLPQDHSQPGTGLNIGCTDDPNCNNKCKAPQCWNCAGGGLFGMVGGHCAIECDGDNAHCVESDYTDKRGIKHHLCSSGSGCSSPNP